MQRALTLAQALWDWNRQTRATVTLPLPSGTTSDARVLHCQRVRMGQFVHTTQQQHPDTSNSGLEINKNRHKTDSGSQSNAEPTTTIHL